MMFMFTSTHVAAMAAKDAEIRGLRSHVEMHIASKLAVFDDNHVLYDDNSRLRETNSALDRTAAAFQAERDKALDELSTARATLAQIAAMETPSCASIGRRMASVARGGAAPAAAPVAEGAR